MSKPTDSEGWDKSWDKPAAAPIQAHSKSQYKRLVAQGADVAPPASDTPKDPTLSVPCCGYVFAKDNYPVYWNPYNEVVQCHNCGTVYVPATELAVADAELSEEREARKELDKAINNALTVNATLRKVLAASKSNFDVLAVQLQHAQAERDALRVDAERLDWCIENKRFPSKTRPITTAAKAMWTCANADGSMQFEGDTAKAAIDAAMKESSWNEAISIALQEKK